MNFTCNENSQIFDVVQRYLNGTTGGKNNIGIKDIFECFMMVLNYRAAEY